MRKLVNPSWHNPAPDGWGADMPLVIPPGPGNPLGTRALALNAPGILIHGSYAAWSIGGYSDSPPNQACPVWSGKRRSDSSARGRQRPGK